MENIYIDESGSMTTNHSANQPYFVVCMLRVKDKDKLKRAYKRFISKHLNRLKEIDKENRMFRDGKFLELKGCCLDFSMKKEFVDFFCQKNLFELIYIRVKNKKIRYGLYSNTARAFNYLLKNALAYGIVNRYLPQDDYCIQLDERNEKTETKYFLENYLNTEFVMSRLLKSHTIQVSYFDSCNNSLVQIADVFSNIYYSCCMNTQKYKSMFEKIIKDHYITYIYDFPNEY